MNTFMQRLLWFSALGTLCGVPALLMLPTSEGGNALNGPAPKLIAQAPCNGTLGTRVIRSAGEARAVLGSRDEAAATAQLAKMLKVANIDWNKQMVILVSGGVQPTSGYRVEVDRLSVARKTLNVDWSLYVPGPDDGVLTVLTHPGQVALCERFEGEVRFSQWVVNGVERTYALGQLGRENNAGNAFERQQSRSEPRQARPRKRTTTLVNFDSLDARMKGVGGAPLADYLARFGIKVESVTQGTTLQVVDARTLYEGKAVTAASPHNLLSQFGSNDPVSFTLRFDPPLVKLEFTRPKLVAATVDGITHPEWTATALDANGKPLDSVRRNLIASFEDVPAAKFTLSGPGIAAVRFESNSQHFAGFSAVLLDDLVLTRRGRR